MGNNFWGTSQNANWWHILKSEVIQFAETPSPKSNVGIVGLPKVDKKTLFGKKCEDFGILDTYHILKLLSSEQVTTFKRKLGILVTKHKIHLNVWVFFGHQYQGSVSRNPRKLTGTQSHIKLIGINFEGKEVYMPETSCMKRTSVYIESVYKTALKS